VLRRPLLTEIFRSFRSHMPQGERRPHYVNR
jgi:hypothetical protein